MNLRRTLVAFAAVAVLLGPVVKSAQAQTTTTFAQFKQQNPNLKPFQYTSGGVFHTTSTALPIFFNYGVKNKYDNTLNGGVFGGNIKGFLNLTSVKNGNTSVQGTFLAQNLQTVVMAFTLNTSALTAPQLAALAAAGLAGKKNLLTVTGTALLSGTKGGSVPSMNADTLTNYSITYTSDFISFPTTIVAKDYNLSFSGASPKLALNGAKQLAAFTASGTGTFDYSTVPEGSSLLFLVGGLLPVGGLIAMRRRKNRA